MRKEVGENRYLKSVQMTNSVEMLWVMTIHHFLFFFFCFCTTVKLTNQWKIAHVPQNPDKTTCQSIFGTSLLPHYQFVSVFFFFSFSPYDPRVNRSEGPIVTSFQTLCILSVDAFQLLYKRMRIIRMKQKIHWTGNKAGQEWDSKKNK